MNPKAPPASTTSPLAALRRYARAERALCERNIAEYAAGIRFETPESARLQDELRGARDAVPWWLGWLAAIIGRRILRQLDYFRRTGQ